MALADTHTVFFFSFLLFFFPFLNNVHRGVSSGWSSQRLRLGRVLRFYQSIRHRARHILLPSSAAREGRRVSKGFTLTSLSDDSFGKSGLPTFSWDYVASAGLASKRSSEGHGNRNKQLDQNPDSEAPVAKKKRSGPLLPSTVVKAPCLL